MFDFSFFSDIIAWHFTCDPQSFQRTLPFVVVEDDWWQKRVCICKTKETMPPHYMPYIGKTLNDIGSLHLRDTKILCLMLTNLCQTLCFPPSCFIIQILSYHNNKIPGLQHHHHHHHHHHHPLL